jgi:hypothetical protein
MDKMVVRSDQNKLYSSRVAAREESKNRGSMVIRVRVKSI